MIKTALGIFSAFLFTFGFFLLDKSATGNAILEGTPSFSMPSVIGLGLVLFSAVITFYLVKSNF